MTFGTPELTVRRVLAMAPAEWRVRGFDALEELLRQAKMAEDLAADWGYQHIDEIYRPLDEDDAE